MNSLKWATLSSATPTGPLIETATSLMFKQTGNLKLRASTSKFTLKFKHFKLLWKFKLKWWIQRNFQSIRRQILKFISSQCKLRILSTNRFARELPFFKFKHSRAVVRVSGRRLKFKLWTSWQIIANLAHSANISQWHSSMHMMQDDFQCFNRRVECIAKSFCQVKENEAKWITEFKWWTSTKLIC